MPIIVSFRTTRQLSHRDVLPGLSSYPGQETTEHVGIWYSGLASLLIEVRHNRVFEKRYPGFIPFAVVDISKDDYLELLEDASDGFHFPYELFDVDPKKFRFQ